MTRVLLIVFALFFLVNPLYAAQATITEAEGFSCMGEDQSRKQTEQVALVDAKRKAVELVLIRIKSETEVKDFMLGKDLLSAYANAEVKIITELEKSWYKDPSSGECYKVRIKAEVIPDLQATEKIAADDRQEPLDIKTDTDNKEMRESENLNVALEPILRIETGMHTAKITGIGIDAENRFLVTGSDDKTVRVWELTSKGKNSAQLIKTLRVPIGYGQEGKIYSVAISPDGSTIACGGWTKDDERNFNIYLFDRESGTLIKRITGLPNAIFHLAYSMNGKFLAATLGSKGIRIYSVSDYSLAGEDREYGDRSQGVDFDKTGRLVTASFDGLIRLYDSAFKLIASKEAPGGSRPCSVSFSPDGANVAVGFSNSTKVDVLSGKDLSYLFSPDLTGVSNGHLAVVSWSSDGRSLYAGGDYKKQFESASSDYMIRKWSDSGRGSFIEIQASSNTITHILPLKRGGILYGAYDPSFGITDASGQRTFYKRAVIADYRDNKEGFLLSPDGSEVRFGYEPGGKHPSIFSIFNRALKPESVGSQSGLAPPLLSFAQLTITQWEKGSTPKFNGKRLKLKHYERSRSLAIAPDGKSFLLGTTWYLRLFDRTGKEQWKVPTPLTTWAVNIPGNGQVAVAAFGDGTIRWYRMTDGVELLAFFPHNDKKRWILWTPEGFFDASPGGADLIGYHLNQGKDKESIFVPISKLYNAFYRPDLVRAKFEGRDISAYAKNINIGMLLNAKTLAPQVRFLTASGNANNVDVTLKAKICDAGGGVGDITIFLNDMPVTVETGNRAIKIVGKETTSEVRQDSCYNFEHLITLQNGANVISLMAYNRDNTIESERDTIELSYKTAQNIKPDLYILTMAVDKYRDGSLRLKYSLSDAMGISESFKEKAKPLFNNVYIYNLNDEDVNKAKLEATFSEIGKKTRREDVFLLFVAGHGITNEKDGVYYYLPVNFRYTGEEAVAEQGVSMNDFKKYFARIQATKSLLLLDTCNSGSFVEAIASRGLVEKTAINKLTRAVGRATIVASSKDQVAMEGYESHGVFTYTVLEALKGKAADQDGKITTLGLAKFIEEYLPQLTYKKWGYEQIPQKELMGMDFPIGMK